MVKPDRVFSVGRRADDGDRRGGRPGVADGKKREESEGGLGRWVEDRREEEKKQIRNRREGDFRDFHLSLSREGGFQRRLPKDPGGGKRTQQKGHAPA